MSELKRKLIQRELQLPPNVAEINWSEQKKADFQRALLNWYAENKKPLPWRETRSPYAIWISEIMSQQTQVETVMPYYARFMAAFPNLTDLAVADDAELLKLWEGLGYYSRARNLKLAAQQIMTDFSGTFPNDLADILSLKGIGPYTAAAIASISFGLAEPAIDGNLLRVTSRLFELEADISKPSSRKVFDEILRDLISHESPGNFNQALMDLGSKVCTPKVAKCEICPLQDYCAAYEHGTSLNFPVKSKKLKQKDLYYAAFALQNSLGEYYLEKRAATGLLANMWIFPMNVLSKTEFDELLSDGFVKKMPDLPEKILRTEFVGEFTHVFSHQKWHIGIVKAVPEESFEVAEHFFAEDKKWLTEWSKIPLAGPQVKMFEILNERKTKLR